MLTKMTTPLGRRLRELREERDMSLREFAEDLGDLSKAHLSDIELGRRNPSPALLAKMADVLKVPLEELQRLDARPPVDEMRRRIEADPTLGFAFRRVVEDKSVSGADLLLFLEEQRRKRGETAPED
jgi:transcriptional regulator with XRE-family HTH domain